MKNKFVSPFVIRKYSFSKFVLFVLLVGGVLGFGGSVEAACDYCSEANCTDYLICEDWDIGTPPSPDWPGRTEPDSLPWHGWQPVGYGDAADNSIISHHSHSGSRCLDQYRAAGFNSCGDLKYAIAGNPTVVYIRFYLYIPQSGESGFRLDYCSHFLFFETASVARVALDFAKQSREYCAGSCPYNPPYSNDDGKGENDSGHEWHYHLMPSPVVRPSSGGTFSVVETEGIPFFFEDHFDEWVLVEWKVDFANKKTSLWVNEIPYIIDYDMDWPYPYATELIISGYSNYIDSDIHYYMDDIVISTSYIGPKDGASDTTPPSRSNPQPTGTLSSGTTSTTISLTTNETAECKYSVIANTNYDGMSNVFAMTDSTDHSTDVTDLEDGNSYIYYIRCQDESGNANTDDFEISFNIASSTTYSISNFINLVTNWLSSGTGLESDVNGDGVVNTRDLGIMMSNWQ